MSTTTLLPSHIGAHLPTTADSVLNSPGHDSSSHCAAATALVAAAARDALRPINQLTAYTHSADRTWQEINLIVAAVLNEARLRTDPPA